ncbi:uncharacterized protein PV06_00756 [Exophiala oligosperma]|uniref:Uncharacterized protein n=1 Tax=Exophiala oligosperma TaxID=215243 RepID=A0A0D2CE45_9EURO|nr:uncharacterized protein PV06_00756 [Exophiala oligosperma]KIW48137.1 hypothetical protein PV06_00756 [Exophiala oligosperma]
MEKDSEVQIEATGPGGKASNSLTVDDPDAGLSLEEKKLKVKLKGAKGTSTIMEGRPQAHPMAVSLVLGFVLGSNEYWER